LQEHEVQHWITSSINIHRGTKSYLAFPPQILVLHKGFLHHSFKTHISPCTRYHSTSNNSSMTNMWYNKLWSALPKSKLDQKPQPLKGFLSPLNYKMMSFSSNLMCTKFPTTSSQISKRAPLLLQKNKLHCPHHLIFSMFIFRAPVCKIKRKPSIPW
jgi:hypothetical protein